MGILCASLHVYTTTPHCSHNPFALHASAKPDGARFRFVGVVRSKTVKRPLFLQNLPGCSPLYFCWPTSWKETDPTYITNQADAKRNLRVPDVKRDAWAWVCELRVRCPRCRLMDQVNDRRFDALGSQLIGSWITSIAYFVGQAHKPGDNAIRLLTSAHNVLGAVEKHDSDGKILAGPMTEGLADAVQVVATNGSQRYEAWVDIIATLKGYNSVENKNKCYDGAALRLHNSTISASFWLSGPDLGSVPLPLGPGPATRTLSLRYLIAGYPGGAQRF